MAAFTAISALALTSCEKDTTDHGVAPTVGEITLDPADDIRPGQTITASVTIPTDGNNIAKRESYWYKDKTGVAYHETKNEGGKSYIEFTAPTSAGEAQVSYSQHVLYGAPDKDGNAYADVTTTKTYNVVKTDIYASKWTDDLDKTLKVYSGLTKAIEEGSGAIYSMTAKDELVLSLNGTCTRDFIFYDNQLINIYEYTTAKLTSKWTRVMTLKDRAVKYLGMTLVSGEIVNLADNTSTPLTLNEETDKATIESLTDKLAAHEVAIVYRLKNGTTNMFVTAIQGTEDGTETGNKCIVFARTFGKL